MEYKKVPKWQLKDFSEMEKEQLDREINKNDKPGIGGTTFKLEIEGNTSNTIQLEIGKDIEFVDEPEQYEDGYKYSFKAISQKAIDYFKLINNE